MNKYYECLIEGDVVDTVKNITFSVKSNCLIYPLGLRDYRGIIKKELVSFSKKEKEVIKKIDLDKYVWAAKTMNNSTQHLYIYGKSYKLLSKFMCALNKRYLTLEELDKLTDLYEIIIKRDSRPLTAGILNKKELLQLMTRYDYTNSLPLLSWNGCTLYARTGDFTSEKEIIKTSKRKFIFGDFLKGTNILYKHCFYFNQSKDLYFFIFFKSRADALNFFTWADKESEHTYLSNDYLLVRAVEEGALVYQFDKKVIDLNPIINSYR